MDRDREARDRADRDRADTERVEIERLLAPDDGWEELVRAAGPASRTAHAGAGAFVPSIPDGRLALKLYRRREDGAVVGRAWFGPGSMGPPGSAHGGAHAAVLDHSLGAAVWEAGYPAFTASYQHEFRSRLPIPSVVDVVTAVTSVDGRKIRASGRLEETGSGSGSPKVYSEASALFIAIPARVLAEFDVDREGSELDPLVDSVALEAER